MHPIRYVAALAPGIAGGTGVVVTEQFLAPPLTIAVVDLVEFVSQPHPPRITDGSVRKLLSVHHCAHTCANRMVYWEKACSRITPDRTQVLEIVRDTEIVVNS